MLILYLIIYILELWVIVSAVVPVEGDADANRLVVCFDRTIRICLGLDNHQLTGQCRGTIVGCSINQKLP